MTRLPLIELACLRKYYIVNKAIMLRFLIVETSGIIFKI
jgi:hypothetical protein